MKLFVPALAFAFAQLLALGATKQAVDVSFPSHAVTFLEVDDALMPRNNLLASGGFTRQSPTSCTTRSSGPDVESAELILQLLVSKCLSDDQLEQAHAWIAPFVPMFTIEIAPVPGACTPAQSQLLLSNDDGDDEDRFKIFSDVGTVVDIFGGSSTTAPPATAPPTNATVLLSDQLTNRLVGVVSFVDSDTSLRLVQEYELKVNVASAIVVVCGQNGVDCPTTCATCTVTANILLVDTYHITRLIECPHSSYEIPVSYLDGSGDRACVCQCRPGWKRAANGHDCEDVGGSGGTCSWNVPNGFVIQNTAAAPTTCSISSITDKGVSVPVAIDNYVAKGRTNAYTVTTDLSTGPHIDLKTARIPTHVVNVDNAPAFPTSYPDSYSVLTAAQLAGATDETDASGGATPADTLYTWEDYRGARKAKIDSLTYSKYGKFGLEIHATDYDTSATCQGCVAIVDNVRPTATQTCTTATCSDLVPTSDNIETINTKIASYFAYASTATNDACSADRCDAKTVDVLPLFGSAYAPGSIDHSSAAATAFFSSAGVRSALNALPVFTDAELAQPTPVAPGQCKSCLKLWTSLKEWWIDYTCGRDYAVKKCEGASTAQTCTFEQCYVASGTTISAATAAIKSTVQTASQNVLDQLDDHIRFNTLTQVHFALSHCTQFATGSEVPTAACKRAVSISDLFDLTSPDAGILGFSATELASLVKWRYKIDTDPWGTWSTSVPSYDFKQATTPVVVEAWTKCGRVYRFEFKIHLHLSAPSQVCDHFFGMWYQTIHAPNVGSTTFCTYPKADFAEVTFDYPANIGLMHARDKLKMNIKEVQCRLKYNWLPTSGASAAVVSSTKLNGNIIQRLAVQAKRTDTTAATSAFHVACDFKYQVYDSPDLYVQTCDQDFAIKDCTDPKIDEPSALTDKSCAADSCVGSSLPGAYEACGGNVVSASGDDTVINTGADQSCCQFCSTAYTTTCKKLPQLPTGHEDIKLCLPSPTNAAPVDYDNGPNLVLSAKTESLFDSSVVSSPTVTVLAGASAMVVVVALVVVRRRRAAAEAAAVDADAYYALLG